MARPLKIPFVADVKDFIRGTSDIEGALDDVSSSLDDVSREAGQSGERAGQEFSDGVGDGLRDVEREAEQAGRDAGDALGDGLADGDPGKKLSESVEGDVEGMRKSVEDDAERMRRSLESETDRAAADVEGSTERMERSFKDAFDDVPRNARNNFSQMSQSVDEGATRSKQSMQEVKQEGLQNMSETFSSFDGSARSFADGIQGTFGGVISALGPLGMAVGAAGAAGIGLITSALDKSKEKAEEVREAVNDLTGVFRDAGEATVPLEDAVERMDELGEVGEDGAAAIEEIGVKARAAGVDVEGYTQALARMDVDALKDYRDQFVESMDDMGHYGAEFLESEVERIDEEIEAKERADSIFSKLNEAGRQRLEEEAEAAEEKKDRAKEALEEEADAAASFREEFASSMQDAYAEAGSAVDEFVEDGKFQIDQYIKHQEEKAAELANYQRNLRTVSGQLSDEALGYVQSLGPKAAPMLQAFVEAPLEEQERLAQIWSTLGVTSSDSYNNAVGENIAREVDGPRVNMEVPQSWEIQDAMNRELARVRVRPVQVRWDIDQAV